MANSTRLPQLPFACPYPIDSRPAGRNCTLLLAQVRLAVDNV